MVFSQTSHKTHSILKVVELNHLKAEKVNGETGVLTGGIIKTLESPAMATSSFSEVLLKPEPLFEDTMFNESECEYFQGLEQWCSDPAKEEPVLTDSLKQREDNSLYTDTLHTPFSPAEWEALDANPSAQVEHYASTTQYPLSPNMDGFTIPDKFLYGSEIEKNKLKAQEPIWDIPNLPVLIGHLPPEEIVDLNSCATTNSINFYGNNNHTHNSQNTEYTSHKTLLMDDEDSLEMKMNPVIPREVESNDVIISEYILSEPSRGGVLQETRRVGGLTLDVTTPWIGDSISTPDVLNFVDQLERENHILPTATKTTLQPQLEELETAIESYSNTLAPQVDYHPITPQSDVYQESETEDVKPLNNKRKRRNSEDSDASYTPNVEYTPRKYRRRKPSVPIKDMILALEESKQQPKRRGRPPKRRESTVSSIGSIDDSTSTTSTHEIKYRELRDKNNEASKRSRMNRKLKELQMEQLAIELEDRNKKLKVKADILEDMTKRLKEALMTAILHK